MSDIPRSGAYGLSPLQVRERLVSLGWGALPILAGDSPKKGAGKRPTIKGWEAFAAYGAPLPSPDALREWDRNSFQAPGTGLAGGRVLVIDLDFSDPALIDTFRGFALECLGETPFVRFGCAPRCALIYRAAEPIASRGYKVENESKEGLDIIGEGKQLVAFGIHPVTRRPYVWESETPLTAGPDAAAEVTAEQVEAFVERVRAVVPLTAGAGKMARQGGGSAEIVRDADGFVVDGREGFLRNQVYRAAVLLHAQGEPLTVAAVAERGWALFCAETRPEPDRWTFGEALDKAKRIIGNIQTSKLKLPQLPVADPTYPDNRVSLADAERAASEAISRFFDHAVPAHVRALADHARSVEAALAKVRAERRVVLLPVAPAPPAWVLRIAVGLGKTEQALRRIAAARGLRVVYAVPSHGLAEEIARRLGDLGITAEIVRGYDRPDPERSNGTAMCQDLDAAKAAIKAHLPVPSTLCEARDGEVKHLCRFAARCGKNRERRATPQVWVVTHASLFGGRPKHVFAPDVLVIDEGFALSAVPSERPTGEGGRVGVERLTLDSIATEDAALYGEDGTVDQEASAALAAARALAVAALRQHGEGQISRVGLGLLSGDADALREAAGLEWRRLLRDIPFGGDTPERAGALAAAGTHNGRVHALAGILSDLADIADGEVEPSDRLRIGLDGKAQALTVTRAPLRTVHETWRAPTLMLDATAPAPAILAPVLGLPVETRADIAAVYSPHITVNQFVAAPVSQRGLGFRPSADEDGADDTAPDPRIISDLVNHITLRAARAYPRIVAVVGSKKLEAKLKASGLPPNVETGHFGALAGLDKWKAAAGIVIIGWSLPPVREAERIASILSGRAVQAITPDMHGRIMFPFAPGGIHVEGRTPFPVKRPQHPDPVVEEVRRQICEAAVEQAVGRIRPLRCEPWEPGFVDIIGDTPLPLAVDAVMRWDDVRLGTWASLVRFGMWLGSRNDVRRAFPELALSEDEARGVVEGFEGNAPIMNLYIGAFPSNRRATYKVRGKGKRTVEALLFPNGSQTHDDLRAELSKRGIEAESVTVASLKTRDRPLRALKVVSLAGRRAATDVARIEAIGIEAEVEAERRRVIRKRLDSKNVNLIFRLKAA